MIIKLLEPLVVKREVIENLSSEMKKLGHEFVYYNTKTTDVE